VTQDANQGEQGAYFYSDSDVDTWYAANEGKIVKSGSIYIIPGTTSGSTFYDVLTGNGGATQLEHSLSTLDQRKTLRDMGKDIIIGNSVESRLFVLRRVQRYIPFAAGGATDPDYTGYVVVENNAEDLFGNTGRYTVRVARI
jgi:hypothetical protein